MKLSLALVAAVPGFHSDTIGVRARLIFVIGVPERLVNDYLICVGTLVRLVRDDAIRSALLHAQTPREFVDALDSNPVAGSSDAGRV